MDKTKSYEISKHTVWEAYERVKANKGATGVDEESIQKFEENLKDNLFKIWNRMSSGSYFPPPVKAVEIPKKNGGVRILGIPTVSDRIAQMTVKLSLSRSWNLYFTPTPMDKDRGNLRLMPFESQEPDVGDMIGCWNLTLKVCSTTSIMGCL